MPRALPFRESLWLGILFFVILAGLGLWYGGRWTLENYLFSTKAQQVEAKVLRKYLTLGDDPVPHIQYGYQVGSLVINCDREVGRNTWNQVKQGGVMPIKYLPNNPSDSRLENTAEDFTAMCKGYLALAGGVAAVILGFVCTIHVLRRKKLVEWLRVSGLTTTGRLLAVDSEMDTEGARQATLRFEFTDLHGQEIIGYSLPLTPAQEQFWRQQATISVFYDPANPRVFTVNPDGMDRPSGG